jgi:tRNA (guanine-N7-)-methyltransferase
MLLRPDEIFIPRIAVPELVDLARLFGRDAATPRAVELEIGSGKGRFLVQAAQRWPERDFVGVEMVGKLGRKIRDKVQRAGLTNVRVLQAEARDLLATRVAAGSLRRVHVYFPDPWPKRRHAAHRLFSGALPDSLARALEPGGELLLATDFDPYFREVVARVGDHEAFVRVLPDPFRDIPRGGFDAIFEAAGIPAFRAIWQRVRDPA